MFDNKMFDSLDISSIGNNENGEAPETNSNLEDISSNSNLNDTIISGFDEPEVNEEKEDVVNETPEKEEVVNGVENGVVNDTPKADIAKTPDPKYMTIDDVDAFLKKKSEYDLQAKQLAEYRAKEDAEKARIAEEQKKSEDEMPDPLYKPEEWRAWTLRQNKRNEELTEMKLNEMRHNMEVQYISRGLDSTKNTAAEKHGTEVFSAAEKWAAEIIKNNPREAMEYLKANPSWEYIVSEYKKANDAAEYSRDPDAYIERKIKERMESNKVEESSNVSSELKNKKVPPKSINSVSSDMKSSGEKVPPMFEGLF